MSQYGGVNLFTLAKEIRKPDEDWQQAIQRARVEIKGQSKAPRKPYVSRAKGECAGLMENTCVSPCKWIKETKTKKGITRKAHCTTPGRQTTYRKAQTIGQAWEQTFEKRGEKPLYTSKQLIEPEWEENPLYKAKSPKKSSYSY